MWRHGAPSGEAAARAHVLAGLGRAGVGGRLRAGYLHRRLAWETRGEVVLEDLWPDRAGEDDAASRMISLTRMQALINAWRVRRGFMFDRRAAVYPEGGANRERVRCMAMMTNGGGQGARMQQRRTSSRWMACRRDFLSDPDRSAAL